MKNNPDEKIVQRSAPEDAGSGAKNVVGAVFIVAWVVLLAVLMIRLPISYMMNTFGETLLPPVLDIVLSACFCAVGVAAGAAGYFLSSKPLLVLSAINPVLMLLSALCFVLYVFFFSRDVLAFALYFANPFCAVLLTPGFLFLGGYAVLALLCPIVFSLLLRKKPFAAGKKPSAPVQ